MQVIEQIIGENERLRKKLDQFRVVEICNLEYRSDRGSHIQPHLDDKYYWGKIVTLNLASSTKLILTNERSDGLLNDIEIVINLNRGSLIVLDDEARYEWLHEIRSEHVEERRLAITYRELSKDHLPGNHLFNEKIDQLLTLATNRI